MTFVGYAAFAFFSTLFREIVKDIEDAEGDLAGDCRTLPIVLGIAKSKIVAAIDGIIFLFFIAYFSFILRGSNDWLKIIILNITVSLPMIYALFLLSKAKAKQDFSKLRPFGKRHHVEWFNFYFGHENLILKNKIFCIINRQ